MLESLRNKRILIVVAHPDDELLGLGASMHRLINDYNVKTRVVILGEGLTSRSLTRNSKEWTKHLLEHKENIRSAQNEIGYHTINTFDFPDNRFDSVDLLDIIKVVENEKENFRPDVILTHHGGDLNIDHQKTFEAVFTACRPMENENVKAIITFETPSGTEWRSNADPHHFLPNLFIKISSENLEAKIRGMQSYKFESRSFPHPRSPEALRIQAQRWGIVVGIKFAEAFNIIRLVN